MPKILITDDDPLMRVLLNETLEKLEDKGVELLTVDNGEEAIEIVRTEKPDLIILDVINPAIKYMDIFAKYVIIAP